MNAVDRSVVIIRPKAPFIEWANAHSADGREYTPESFTDDCTTLLIPECDSRLEAKRFVNDKCEEIFQFELEKWSDNRWAWPQHRTQKIFWEWFSMELHSFVLDAAE
jgi:hypothetical protein